MENWGDRAAKLLLSWCRDSLLQLLSLHLLLGYWLLFSRRKILLRVWIKNIVPYKEYHQQPNNKQQHYQSRVEPFGFGFINDLVSLFHQAKQNFNKYASSNPQEKKKDSQKYAKLAVHSVFIFNKKNFTRSKRTNGKVYCVMKGQFIMPMFIFKVVIRCLCLNRFYNINQH